MKKRTKKQKVIADYRRKIELIKKITIQNQLLENSVNIIKKIPLNKKSLIDEKKSFDNKNLKCEENFLIQYFKKDIKKTILLSLFIFSLEIAIYFAMINKIKIKIF